MLMKEQKEDKALLAALIGEEVCVAVSIHGVLRSGFYTQMSIQGTLEVHPEDDNAFRVVRDKRTYTYFQVKDVMLVNFLTEEVATINVRIDQEEDDS